MTHTTQCLQAAAIPAPFLITAPSPSTTELHGASSSSTSTIICMVTHDRLSSRDFPVDFEYIGLPIASDPDSPPTSLWAPLWLLPGPRHIWSTGLATPSPPSRPQPRLNTTVTSTLPRLCSDLWMMSIKSEIRCIRSLKWRVECTIIVAA